MAQTEEHRREDGAVPRWAYESLGMHMGVTVRRLIIAIVILGVVALGEAVLLYMNNLSWLHYIEQYDFESYEYTQDGHGVNIIGDSNGVDVNGAEAESEAQG